MYKNFDISKIESIEKKIYNINFIQRNSRTILFCMNIFIDSEKKIALF